jgi:hypothetical protein
MRLPPSAGAILILAASACLSSCSPASRPPRAVVALDEAFSAARPSLAADLEAPGLFGAGPFGLFDRALVVPVSMTEGAGKALDAAIAEGKRRGKPTVLVTSPLLAKAIIGGGNWSGDPALLVPEWRGESVPGLAAAVSDPTPAYAQAGSAAGAYLLAISEGGGSPSCGVIFSESPSRPRRALTAFAEAFAAASEGRSLFVRELIEPDFAGKGEEAAKDSPAAATAPSAEAAAKELLGSDIRLLFVALGSASGAAIRAATRPGLAIGADFPSAEAPSSLAFRILPDEAGLARALDRERRVPEEARKANSVQALPSILVPGPSAGIFRAGKSDLAAFLSEAAKGGR